MRSRQFYLNVGLLVLVLWYAVPQMGFGLSVTDYSPAANDRFSSGYTSTGPVTAPVPNTDAAFVGLGYDWSGVGWEAANPTKSFGMISPRHYLVASHYGGASYLQFLGADGSLCLGTQQSVVGTGCGPSVSGSAAPDVSLGTLSAPLPASAQVAYYPVLDLVDSVATPSYTKYLGKNYLMYGFTGKVAVNTTVGQGTSLTGYFISSSANSGTSAAFQIGDSGSPAFMPWKDPNGKSRLTILGHNWAVDNVDTPTTNYHALLPASDVVAKLNTMMAPQGYALRWVATAANTWNGSLSGLFGTKNNWTIRSLPSDNYVAFSGDKATNRTISLGADQTLRGMMFLSANSGNFFTFLAGNTLNLGRGGIVNYDPNNPQAIDCNISLTDAQWWDGGPKGLVLNGTINTGSNGGCPLVVDGAGLTYFSGVLTGTGCLAKEGTGTLTLAGTSALIGPIFVHNGVFNLTGNMGAANTITVESSGTFQGTGALAIPRLGMKVDGALSPGDASTSGTLNFAATSGTLIFGSSGKLIFNAGTTSDLVAMGGGTAALGGTLQVVPGTGFNYANSYKIFSGLGTAPIGKFSTVTGLATGFDPSFSAANGDYSISFVPTTYSAWQLAHFTQTEIDAGLANDSADPDGDGIQNLQEYALGMDPRVESPVGIPVVSSLNGYLTLTLSKNPNATDLTYSVEVTGNLADAASWSAADTTVLTNTATMLVVRDNVLIADAPRRFIRVRLTRQ